MKKAKRSKRKKKEDLLADKFGGPIYFQFLITPNHSRGKHKLVFYSGWSTHFSEIILTEEHSTPSLIKRIEDLKLNMYGKRSNEAHERSQKYARFLASLSPWQRSFFK